MKTTYQQFHSYFAKCVRTVMKVHGLDWEAAFDQVKTMRGLDWEAARAKVRSGNVDESEMKALYEFVSIGVQLRVVRPEARFALRYGKCVHLVARDEAFLDWLVSCAPTLEAGAVDALAELAGQDVCVLHFPTQSKYRCVVFTFMPACEETGNGRLCLWPSPMARAWTVVLSTADRIWPTLVQWGCCTDGC